jgi:WbqC-like protein family
VFVLNQPHRSNDLTQSPITPGMQIVIMQPTYLPWMGYLDLIDQAEVFVFLDSVQFERQSWQQRNRLKIQGALQWLSVPVLRSGHSTELIRAMQIERSAMFPQKHIRTIEQNYRRAPYFDKYFASLKAILEADERLLSNLNQRLIRWMAEMIGVKTTFRRSSDLQAQGRRSELLANICLELGFSTYLSPLGSAGYILEATESFELSGITVVFQHYEHPQYRQLSDPFVPFASALDLLFNEGERSLEIMRSGRRPHYSLDAVRQLAAKGSTESSL